MGLENAISEITLVLFTSLAPSGAVAIAIVAMALACGAACFAMQGIAVLDMGNHIISVRELVPAYWPMVAAFVAFGATGVGIFAGMSLGKIRYRASTATAALACAFIGIFIMRFAFYMMHLTVGVGV